MDAERATIAGYLPFLSPRSTLRLLRGGLQRMSRPQLHPALHARTRELRSERAGRLTAYTNVDDFAHAPGRPLVLLHGVHTSASAFELNALFEALREERPLYALDLPGFGSSERAERAYVPELYISAIGDLLELATRGAQAADVVAVGLTSEYAARAAIESPERVHSLTLIAPTGFAVKREQDSFERASRNGKPRLPMRIASRLGLSPLLYRALATERSLRYFLKRAASCSDASDDAVRYSHATTHQPGAEHAALAYLSGALHPAGNPQSVYTRVHCPTLILYAEGTRQYGSLETFVKWHEYFSAERVDDVDLKSARGADQLLDKMARFWSDVSERELAEGQSGVYTVGSPDDATHVATVSSY